MLTTSFAVKPRLSKFRNRSCYVDGRRFDSEAEARRYGELKLLWKAGKINDLRCQLRFPLGTLTRSERTTVPVGHYVADFIYTTASPRCFKEEGNFSTLAKDIVVEDVKGVRTELYKWKKKHFEAQYEVEITEVRA